jgi:hypothetical protein
MARQIYECDLDKVFLRAFTREEFQHRFLSLALPDRAGHPLRVVSVKAQSRHAAHSGTIDILLGLDDGQVLLIENKIDAGYSVTRAGDAQPGRYRASVQAYARNGILAHSVLLAPATYLAGSRSAALFDRAVSYEDLRPALSGGDAALLEEAITWAATPYEPDPNAATAAFFAQYYTHAVRLFPDLVLKQNPNGDGIRPTGSRTIYVDVPRTLRVCRDMARPKMSIQCLDSGAATASVKIMISGLGRFADSLHAPDGLRQIGGYLRSAGQSLGCVIDTPRLDTQRPFSDQLAGVEKGLEAANALRIWWNAAEGEVRSLVAAASQ